MTENRSDARLKAELVFGKMQAPPSARDRAFEEINAVRAAGAEKVQRLREARLARELQDKAALKGPSEPGLPDTD